MKWTWQQKRSKNIKKDIHVLHQPNAHNFTAGLLSVRLVGYISGGCLLSISCLQHVVWKIISPVKTQTLVSGCVVSASYHGENRGAPPRSPINTVFLFLFVSMKDVKSLNVAVHPYIQTLSPLKERQAEISPLTITSMHQAQKCWIV